ncbi:MAG TPA: c-type cytochrome [Clostridia bacterium]|nr:c-type cytochrome [Clostridia bacterium]
MKVIRKVSLAVLVVTLGVTGAAAQKTLNETKAQPSGQLERGRYLVERVGVCADCHSPRNKRGEFIKGRELTGAPLMFKPTVPVPGWVEVAPGIAGLPGWNEADAIKFLSTGTSLNGRIAAPPMPPFRLSERDAAAVVAYLKSMNAEGSATATAAPKKTAAKKSASGNLQ